MTPNDALAIAQATALGVVMQRPDEAAEVFSMVHVEDFDPPYLFVAEAIHGLRIAAKQISPLAVIDEMTQRATLSRAGGQAEVWRISQHGFGDAGYAVQVIARHVNLRKLLMLGTRVVQATTEPDADPLVLAKGIVDKAQGVVDYIEATNEDVEIPTVGELLRHEDDARFDWVIPGLLERGDRLVLTGVEGVGKSMMFRQLAVAAASGVHPFSHAPIEPQRVLLVDAENGRRHIRRQIRGLVLAGSARGSDPSDRLWVEARPEGLDLSRPEDEAWLVRRAAILQPSLMLIGPLYRLHVGDPNSEELARTVARVLDRCRSAAHCALVVEAHAGHPNGYTRERPVRPVGSSLWLRWPEFGYGLRPTESHQPPSYREVEVVAWRGDREERAWPRTMFSGGTWPWRGADRPQQPPEPDRVPPPPAHVQEELPAPRDIYHVVDD